MEGKVLRSQIAEPHISLHGEHLSHMKAKRDKKKKTELYYGIQNTRKQTLKTSEDCPAVSLTVEDLLGSASECGEQHPTTDQQDGKLTEPNQV